MVRPVMLWLALAAAISLGGCGSGTSESGPGPGPDGQVQTFSGAETAAPLQPPLQAPQAP